MNKYIMLFFLLVLLSCTSNKDVFWCGDRACINKAEKKEFFKKNMIVELRNIGKKTKKEYSKVNKILNQGKLNKENLAEDENGKIKLTKREKKQRIKDEKKLSKQLLKQERQRIKDEKKLSKQLLKQQLQRIKDEKKIAKKLKKDEKERNKNKEVKSEIYSIKKSKKAVKKPLVNKSKVVSSVDDKNSLKFVDLVKKIKEKSYTKSFPNINAPLE
jgi:hypothetical protein